MIKAVLLDGHLKSTLAAVRSLGSRSIEVACGSDRRAGMALHSRYASQSFSYSNPIKEVDEFLKKLITIGKEHSGKPVLYTFSDATSALVSRNRDDLSEYFTLVLPETEQFESTLDKSRTVRLAMNLGIPVPRTYFPEKTSELNSTRWPIVVKPRSNVSWKGRTGRSSHVSVAFSQDEFEALFDTISSAMGEPPIIQEYIQGKEIGLEALCDHGAILSWCAHERLRSLDPAGGASVYKKIIEPAPEVREYATQLLAHLKWHGPVMVEFKQTKDGVVYLIEINGRFWGSLPLSVFAGADFPYGVYQLAHKEKPEPFSGKTDEVSRYLLGDIAWLLKTLFKSSPLRALTYPGRMAAFVAFFKAFGTGNEDVWDSSDPAPFFWDIIDKLF